MHGRPRKPAKPEDAAASAAKAEKLRSLQSQFLSNHQNRIYSKEALELSARLLEINPESYTAWNYRKQAVGDKLSLVNSDPDSVKAILDEELRVVESALRQNFKSYGAWHHRKWVLSKGHSSIDHELRLLDKFQKADSRNFHAWNYRRFVAGLMKRSDEEELKCTTDMIDTNFSNYSAWHNRSVLLSNLLDKKVEGFSKEKVLPEEYELVHQAIFTEPDDQSGWFYHLWLLNQTVNIESPILLSSWPAQGSDLVILRDKCLGDSATPLTTFHYNLGSFPLVLCFNQAVEGMSSSTITVECGTETIKDLVWRPVSVNKVEAARFWVTHLKFADSNTLSKVKVGVGHSCGIISSGGIQYSHSSEFEFTIHTQPAGKDHTGSLDGEMFLWGDDNFKIYDMVPTEESPLEFFGQLTTKDDCEPTSNWRAEIIAKEIECFRELLSMMDCEIGKLSLARLLIAYHATASPCSNETNYSEVLDLYNDLMMLDQSHLQYYKDEHSIVLLQQVTSSRDSLLKHLFQYKHYSPSCFGNFMCLRLNNLSLTRLGAFEKLLWVQMLDLSHNELRSIEGMEAMQCLSFLNLSDNRLGSLTTMGPLKELKSLKVLDISYNKIGDNTIDTTRYLCPSPLSHSVGREWEKDELVTAGVDMSDYWGAYVIFRALNLEQLDIVGNAIADEKFRSFLVKVVPSLKWLDGEKLTN